MIKRLFLISVALLASLPAFGQTWVYTYGETDYTDGYTSSGFQPQNFVYGGTLTFASAGTVDSLSVWGQEGTASTVTIKPALYETDGTLVGQCGTITMTSTIQWHDSSTCSLAVTAQTYVVLFSAENANAFYGYDSANDGSFATEGYATFPQASESITVDAGSEDGYNGRAQFTAAPTCTGTDDFSGFTNGDQLESSSCWTKYGGAGGTDLDIQGGVVTTDSTNGARRVYTYTDQGQADMYAQASIPSLTGIGTNEQHTVIVRSDASRSNHLFVGLSNANNAKCGKVVADTLTSFTGFSVPGADATAIRIEAEGTEVRCYYDNGSGFTLFHTETGETDGQSNTLAGFAAAYNVDNIAVFDNFETGEIVGATPTTYYFNPNSTGGTASGLSDANAFYIRDHVHNKVFNAGDKLFFRAGTEHTLSDKIKNDTMVGTGSEPFEIDAYHMVGGTETRGLGGEARPILQGLDPAAWDWNGGMDGTDLCNMIPEPNGCPGAFNQGSSEGLLNWYQGANYTLNLEVSNLHLRYSGGRAIRLTQAGAVIASGGFTGTNLLLEGTMKQGIHTAGVRDFVLQDSWITRTGTEWYYWPVASNRQAAFAVKGPGNPDTLMRVTFRRIVVWDTRSSECVNYNSGFKGGLIEDLVLIDCGLIGIYVDRTNSGIVRRNIVLKTGRTSLEETDGIGSGTGRGDHAILVQNEKACGSFNWCDVYNTQQDWLDYRTQQILLDSNIAIGYSKNIGFISQGSTASDATHLGEAHGAGVYFYNNLSLDPATDHVGMNTGTNATNYLLDTTVPPRIWTNAFINVCPTCNADLVDRNDADFETVVSDNYVSSDMLPATAAWDQNVTSSGITMPLSSYFDLSSEMTLDADDLLTYSAVRDFIENTLGIDPDNLADKSNMTDFVPTIVSSGVTLATRSDPPSLLFGAGDGTDFKGENYSATVPFGPFNSAAAPPGASILVILESLRRGRP